MASIVIAPYDTGLSTRIGSLMQQARQADDGILLQAWPELDKSSWPDMNTAFVLATGNGMKVIENRRPLAFYDITFARARDFFGDTVPDSEEHENHSIDIAAGKVSQSVMVPWSSLSDSDQKAALASVFVEDPRHIVVAAEDRAVHMDPILRDHPIFDDLRNNTGPGAEAYMDAFKDGHPFPGKRFKEISSAAGGVPNFVSMIQEAAGDYRAQGKSVSEEHVLEVSYYLKPLEYGHLPLPAEGIVAHVREEGFTLRPVNDIDRAKMRAGQEFDIGDFEIPRGYEGSTDEQGQQITSRSLLNSENNYFDNLSPQALVLDAFVNAVDIPKRDKPLIYRAQPLEKARLLTSRQLGEETIRVRSGDEIAGHKQSRYVRKYDSLAMLDESVYVSEGTIIDNPLAGGGNPNDIDTLIKIVEAQLLFSYHAALKTHGGFQGTGRPVMVQKDFADRYLRWYGDFVNKGTVGAKQMDVFEYFKNHHDLQETLEIGGWHFDQFKENPGTDEDLPDIQLLNEKEFCALMGVSTPQELGFTMALLGTASSKITTGLRDAYDFTRLAAQDGMMMTSGGGTREIMGVFFESLIHAHQQGHKNYRKLGIRVPVVSRCEGSMREFLEKHNLSPTSGRVDGSMFSMMDDRVTVYEDPYMTSRQHAIYAPAHIGNHFIGGVGTAFEAFGNMLHNLYVEKRGYGLFPGFAINNQIKPAVFVNSPMHSKEHQRYFEIFLNQYSKQQKEAMGIRVYETPQQAYAFNGAYGRSLGFEIPRSGRFTLSIGELCPNL